MDFYSTKVSTTGETFQICAIEIPQYISVKTRFITKDASNLLEHPRNVYSLSKGSSTMPKTKTSQPPPVVLNGLGKSVRTTTQFSDASTLTDAPPPARDRMQQTEPPEEKIFETVGIQCNIEDDEENNNYFGDSTEADEECIEEVNSEDQKKSFDQFVKSKTCRYTNGKVECLVCGEIAKTRAMEYHMAAHYKPRKICPHCGIVPMFRKHKCLAKRATPKKGSYQLRCPYYDCRVSAISLLELYDHINEHVGLKRYYCRKHCDKMFPTASELRQHQRSNNLQYSMPRPLLANLNNKRDRIYRCRVFPVYSISKRIVFVKSFLSMQTKKREQNLNRLRCHICLKYCNNAFKFINHTNRCLKNLKYRKHYKITMASKIPTNGH